MNALQGTVVVERTYLEELKNDSLMLEILRALGVDTWECWGDALMEYDRIIEDSIEGESK